MDTDKLIACLTEDADPVRRLPSPWVRTASWFAIAIPYVAVIVMMMAPRDDLALKFSDFRFLLEQVAALCTAIGAAVAAFQSIVPGYNRQFLLLPLVPLSVWLASLGQGCVETWLRGSALLSFTSDFLCIPALRWLEPCRPWRWHSCCEKEHPFGRILRPRLGAWRRLDWATSVFVSSTIRTRA